MHVEVGYAGMRYASMRDAYITQRLSRRKRKKKERKEGGRELDETELRVTIIDQRKKRIVIGGKKVCRATDFDARKANSNES